MYLILEKVRIKKTAHGLVMTGSFSLDETTFEISFPVENCEYLNDQAIQNRKEYDLTVTGGNTHFNDILLGACIHMLCDFWNSSPFFKTQDWQKDGRHALVEEEDLLMI